jgi:hypothetical protein
MSIESRLKKLEETGGHWEWASLRPDDATPDEWEVVRQQLLLLPPNCFAPWRDYNDVVGWLGRQHPSRVIHCPDVVLLLFADDGRIMDLMLREGRRPTQEELEQFTREIAPLAVTGEGDGEGEPVQGDPEGT